MNVPSKLIPTGGQLTGRRLSAFRGRHAAGVERGVENDLERALSRPSPSGSSAFSGGVAWNKSLSGSGSSFMVREMS